MTKEAFDFNIVFAIVGLILGLIVAYFTLYYGIRDGLIKKEIIGDYKGNYLKGNRAIFRGVFLIIIGLINLAGSVIAGIFLYNKMIS
jgi:hypothetical protein